MNSSAALLTRDEIVRGLLHHPGVTRQVAERVADLELERRGQLSPPDEATLTTSTPDPAAAIEWPLRLTLPWSYLVTDNRSRLAVIVHVGSNRTPIPKLVMQAAFREAKGKIRALARDVLNGTEPTTEPLRIEARVYLPDNKKHDVVNFAKCVHDALNEVVYVDDHQLHDVRWLRAGVDVDRPRAELTITPHQE